MFQANVLYHHPADPAAFDAYFDEVHAPLTAKIPGLLRFTVSRPTPDATGTPPQFHLVATLEFEDEAAFKAGMTSDEGKAAGADLVHFAMAGSTRTRGPAAVIV